MGIFWVSDMTISGHLSGVWMSSGWLNKRSSISFDH